MEGSDGEAETRGGKPKEGIGLERRRCEGEGGGRQGEGLVFPVILCL